MALVKLSRAENVMGDFYVDSSCIDCDLCRQIAPTVFSRMGEQSAVHSQPQTPAEELSALKALICCPTASIGTQVRHDLHTAIAAYPEQVVEGIYFCGFAAESSYGASSYLIVRPEGNILVDSPRFVRPLVEHITALGGIKTIFLTHRDDVADQADWAGHFNAARVMHHRDIGKLSGIEVVIRDDAPMALDEQLLVIPTPGHTAGHSVLLYRNKYLFSGDHLWWSTHYQALNAARSVCWYSWEEQIKSMECLLDYSFEWVLPGHGRRAHAGVAEMQTELRDCIVRMKEC